MATIFVGTVLVGHTPPVAAADSGSSVAVTPTTVVDGQPVAITVKSQPGFTVYRADVKLCRPGVTYQTSAGVRPAADFATQEAGNCPNGAISTSGDSYQSDTSTVANAATPEGETFQFRVGAGKIDWSTVLSAPGQNFSLTCGPDAPCSLVVEVQGAPNTDPPTPATWHPFTQTISYAKDDPFAGCGGPADGVLSTGGSDRMFDTWVQWTKGECQLPGRKGSAGRASFTGEGDAVKGFAAGAIDLAYSAGGYDPAMGLVPADASQPNGGRRPEVNVPIGLNATVLAVGGGNYVGGHVVPYSRVRMTLADVAGILRGASEGVSEFIPEIQSLNPSINPVFDPSFFNGSIGSGTGGDTGDVRAVALPAADANSWYMTRLLTTRVSRAWKVPDVAVKFPGIAGHPRGIDNALALASPSFSSSLLLLSGRPPVLKILSTHDPRAAGGFWYLTDLQTAKAFGLNPVQIETVPGSGNFVGPTPATMAAAVPTMVRDHDGVRIGDPNAGATADKSPIYPLTYVEYALAPAQRLLNDDCTPRSSSQTLLTGWLKYITGAGGQASLAPGMLPLTPALAAEADGAIAKVGAAAVTGACAKGPNPSTTAATAPRPATTPGRSGGAVSSSGHNRANPTSGGSAATAPSNAAPPPGGPVRPMTGSAPQSQLAFPAFAGVTGMAFGGTIVAILGLIALSSLAAFAPTAFRARRRRRPPPSLE